MLAALPECGGINSAGKRVVFTTQGRTRLIDRNTQEKAKPECAGLLHHVGRST